MLIEGIDVPMSYGEPIETIVLQTCIPTMYSTL